MGVQALLRVGDVVKHPRFGVGTVVQVRNGGYDAKVDFRGVKLWVPSSVLEVIASNAIVAGKLAGLGKRTRIPKPKKLTLTDRTVVESFRLGVVPDVALKNWTFGRDKEIKQCMQWLKDDAEGAIVVEGEYGTGKTHLLRLLTQLGLEQKFAVAFTRVVPAEENTSFPFRLYSEVVQALRIPYQDAEADLATVIYDICKEKKRSVLDEHPFFGPFLQAVRADKDRPEDWLALMGSRIHNRFFPTYLDYTTVANLACNMLSAISVFVVEDVGCKGLLIIIDEAEMGDIRRYPYHWRRTLNFMKGLILTANDDSDLDEEVVKKEDGCRRGVKTNLVYSGHYPLTKYYFKMPSMMKVAVGLTTSKILTRMLGWRDTTPVLKLAPVDTAALSELFRRFVGVYCSLRGMDFPYHMEKWILYGLLFPVYESLGNGSIRIFVKAMAEVMDFIYHYPGKQVEELQELLDQW